MDPKKLPPMMRRRRHRPTPSPTIDPYSTVTGYSQVRIGHVTVVHVTTALTGTVYYHWYRDGVWVASTCAANFGFRLPSDEQIRIDVLATTEEDWTVPQEIDGHPSRKTLWWVRSMDEAVEQYRIEEDKDGGGYSAVGVVWDEPGRWDYRWMTPVLEDLATYTWKIYPVDTASNDGTPITLGPEKIVRTPDAPEFQVTFDDGTTRVEFAEAA